MSRPLVDSAPHRVPPLTVVLNPPTPRPEAHLVQPDLEDPDIELQSLELADAEEEVLTDGEEGAVNLVSPRRNLVANLTPKQTNPR